MLAPSLHLPHALTNTCWHALQATATRAGILYISEGHQWHNMVQSWLQRVVKPYADKAKWKV